MNCLRRCVPVFALGLTIALAGAAFAQNANQSGGDKKAACCKSDCCGDSCQMKKDGMKNHATSSDKDACCCGDSCQMKKGEMKNHTTSSDKDGCCGCCGDSCNMKDMKSMKGMKEKP